MSLFSWERPIGDEILRSAQFMLREWRRQESRDWGWFGGEQKGIVKGNIMAYETMIEKIREEIEIREQAETIKKNNVGDSAWDMGTVYKKLEDRK